uniref:Uncharacterized protein n=1 Tax=Rhizophora mucronata TaxID=61149 RepID=A0A2P2PK54_RHIMU
MPSVYSSAMSKDSLFTCLTDKLLWCNHITYFSFFCYSLFSKSIENRELTSK